MKYVVAVSGGVDSVVLLDLLARTGKHELVVAHFDHGIRSDSADDARFVAGLSAQYNIIFETEREELGIGASEATARARRYAFLHDVAKKHDAKIVTAHHKDDVNETIAINLLRGTGWRGLAGLNSATIERPLTAKSKSELYDYALTHNLEWVEDSTNHDDKYLRNRVRSLLYRMPTSTRTMLYKLWKAQISLGAEIDSEVTKLLGDENRSSRYFFTQIDEAAGLELLRGMLAQNAFSLTRPQRQRLLLGVKTARPDTSMELGDQITAYFTQREFIVK